MSELITHNRNSSPLFLIVIQRVQAVEIIKRTLQSCRRITLIDAIRGIAERK